jgi:hypothetical protein
LLIAGSLLKIAAISVLITLNIIPSSFFDIILLKKKINVQNL